MLKRVIIFLVFALAATGAVASSWTDGQAEWARHGSRHGAWDCYGDCPSGRPAADAVPHQRASMSRFDGSWTVSADGPCSSAGTSQVMISSGRIMGQNGSGGHVTPGGTVSTVGNLNGMTVVGEGHITARSGSGTYTQSDGCSSSWNAVKF